MSAVPCLSFQIRSLQNCSIQSESTCLGPCWWFVRQFVEFAVLHMVVGWPRIEVVVGTLLYTDTSIGAARTQCMASIVVRRPSLVKHIQSRLQVLMAYQTAGVAGDILGFERDMIADNSAEPDEKLGANS